MKDLRALFEEQIQDLHSGETQIIESLPDMIDAAHDDDLRTGLVRSLSPSSPMRLKPVP